tara:strand:+ start:211 stop:591 length:381 start_codon:yes stop_codon:yes gene_type:complete
MLRKTSLIDKPIYQENKNDEQVIQLAKNNAELDLLANIQEGYKDWLSNGNKGSTQDYLDSLSIDDLKLLSLKEGGIVDKANRPKEPVAVKDIDLTQELLKTADYLSRLSDSERATIDWMLKKMGNK